MSHFPSKRRPYRVALTGGINSGKTSSFAGVTDYFVSRGFNLFSVPEASTILKRAGFDPSIFPDDGETFQRGLFSVQRSLEKNALEMAASSDRVSGNTRPTIVISDRGLMDGSAFCSPEAFGRILEYNKMTRADACDRRYDLVIHLATSPREFYGNATNAVRTEDYEEAVLNDQKVRRAWTGHPALKIINNRTDFAQKVNRVIGAICAGVNEPVPFDSERRFLLESAPDLHAIAPREGIHVESSTIRQTYLYEAAAGDEACVSERQTRGSSLYFHRSKGPSLSPVDRPTRERLVGVEEYDQLLGARDPATREVTKSRHCFVHGDSHMQVDIHDAPARNLAILTVSVEHGDTSPLRLPSFLHVAREITDDPTFRSVSIARGAYSGELTLAPPKSLTLEGKGRETGSF